MNKNIDTSTNTIQMQIQLTFGVVLGIAYVLKMGYLFLDPDSHYSVKFGFHTRLNHTNS